MPLTKSEEAAISLQDNRFGSHLQGPWIAPSPRRDPATYGGMANKPWDKPGRAQYIGYPVVSAEIDKADSDADAVYTTPTYFATSRQDPRPGIVNVSISGTFTGTVSLQRCLNADLVDENGDPVTEVWNDVQSWTSPIEYDFQTPNWSAKWRIGVKKSGLSNGTVVVVMSQA